MITQDKITDIFCMVDEFSKKFDMEIAKGELISSNGIRRRHRNASLSDGEIMTILIVFHFGTFANFKHYYLHYIRVHLHQDFPDAVSYNRFVELESRVFFKLMFFLKLYAFGRCSGISFVDSTMIPVCHNLRRYANKVFKGMATDGKGTMGWCHGFKLHFTCNDRGKSSPSVLPEPMWMTGIPKSGTYLPKSCTAGFFADRGYISPRLFEDLFKDGIHLVTGIKVNMKNRLMPFWDKIMLRKRFVIECINDMLKNTAKLVHSRHRSINNFLMNLVAALAAYFMTILYH